MKRSFDPQHLVDLPGFDIATALAVGRRVIRRARARKHLPALVKKSIDRYATAHRALENAYARKLAAGTRTGRPGARAADAAVDNAWAALHGMLAAWARLPDDVPGAAPSRKLLHIVFPDGLRFTKLGWDAEWAESESRLHTIDDQGYATAIAALGGGPFLGHLREAHQRYGKALGITADGPSASQSPAHRVRELHGEAMTALRTYVVRVVAHGDESEPSTLAMVDDLLKPLVEHEPRRAQPAATPPAPAG